jgi:phosphatidylserine/phosphatidylglycerophosphate/cardiolipin synthase-like enzyme
MLRAPRLFALALAALSCRSTAAINTVDLDAAALTPGDLGVSADAPAVMDRATPAADAAPLDAPDLDDATLPDAPRADVNDVTDARMRTDVPRDAAPRCVCPALPTSCPSIPSDSPTFSPEPALLEQVVGLVACADQSLHIALYETLWDCVPNAIRARLDADPDLTVSIVVDNEDCPVGDGGSLCPIRALEGHPRVTLISDNRAALMHHKFMVVDGTRVWVGSANSSQQSYCTDSNDAVVISEPAVVAAFESEFQRMFRDRAFGPIAPTAPTTGGAYTVHFSPRTPSTTAAPWFTDMIAAVTNARTSVEFIISAWTRAELSDAMLAARARGVTVRGIVAPNYLNDAPAVALRNAGVEVRVGDVHSKLLLVDGDVVITGSANWSASAWSNNENSLWIRDANAASTYASFFNREFLRATVPVMDRDR